MSWTGCIDIAPCETCIGGVSPSDFRQWAYVKKTPSSPESAVMCSTGQGDPYLGMIGNECECDHPEPKAPEYNGIEYLRFMRDCPPWPSQSCFGNSAECSFQKCHASGNKYGNCGYCHGFDHYKYHYWWVRNWDAELATLDAKMNCCTLDPTTPDRTRECPSDIWFPAPVCVETVQEYCDPENWDDKCDTYMKSNLDSAHGKKEYAGALLSYQMENWVVGHTTITKKTGTNTWNEYDCDSIEKTCIKKECRGTGKETKPICTPVSCAWGTSPCQEATTKSVDPKDPFISHAIEWCTHQDLQGVCAPYLERICSTTTKEEMAKDTTGNLAKLCACYMDSDEYLLPGVIPKECDTTCQMVASTGGIPIYEYGGTSKGMIPKTCKQNTCVMDDVTVSYINSQIGGDTTFDQVCDCPSGSACTCVMNGINISEINSVISGGNSIDQYCSMCSVYAADKGEAVDCKTGLPPTPPPTPPSPPSPTPPSPKSSLQRFIEFVQETWDKHQAPILVIFAVIMLLIIVAVIVITTSTRRKKKT